MINEASYRELFDKIDNGIIILNKKAENYILINFNNIAKKIDKLNFDNDINKSILIVYPNLYESELFHTIKRVWETGLSENIIGLYYCDNRRSGYRNYSIYQLSSMEIVLVFTDITLTYNINKQRDELIAELSSKNKELENIIYVSSHDLRTPLVNIEGFSAEVENSLKSCSDIIETVELPEDIKSRILNELKEDCCAPFVFVRQSIRKMEQLISGLLKISRLGMKPSKPEMLNMNSIIEKAIDSLKFQIDAKKIKIDKESLPNCYADKLEFIQIFTNLIENSIKYSSPNRQCHIKVKGFTNIENCLYIVEDNGIGIHENHINKIFQIFHRLDPKSDIQGEGLGLTIVKRLLDKNHGTITVKSEVDIGTSFTLSLPKSHFN